MTVYAVASRASLSHQSKLCFVILVPDCMPDHWGDTNCFHCAFVFEMQRHNVAHSAPTLPWCVDANPQVRVLGLQRCAATALARTAHHMLMQGGEKKRKEKKRGRGGRGRKKKKRKEKKTMPFGVNLMRSPVVNPAAQGAYAGMNTCGRPCSSMSCCGATLTKISRMLRASDRPWQSKQAMRALTCTVVSVVTILEGASSCTGASSMSSSSSSASCPPASHSC